MAQRNTSGRKRKMGYVSNARDVGRSTSSSGRKPVRNARSQSAGGTSARSTGRGSSTGSTGRSSSGSRSRTASGQNVRRGPGRPSSAAKQTASKITRANGRNRYAEGYERDDSLRNEIIIIITICLGALCFLSYLRLCGTLGHYINVTVFGLMGSIGYAFPFMLIAAALFAVANRGNRSVFAKILYCTGMFMFISAFVQLVAGGADPANSFTDYFTKSVLTYAGDDRTYGGFFGGAICKILCPLAGNIGTGIIIAAVIIIFFLLICGKALFTALARNGREKAELAREHRRLEREEELERRREAGDDGEDMYGDDPDEDVFDDSEDPEGLLLRRRPRQRRGFIDFLKRQGMNIDTEIIEDIPEYREFRDKCGQGYEVSEMSVDESLPAGHMPAEGNNKADGTGSTGVAEQGSNIPGNGYESGTEDFAAEEMRRKFGNKPGAGNGPSRVSTPKGLTRTYMVDEEEPAESGNGSDRKDAGKKSEASEKTPAAAEHGSDTGSAGNSRNEEEGKKPRTSSGSVCFTDMSAAAAAAAAGPDKPAPPQYEFPPINLLLKGNNVAGSADERELESTIEKLRSAFESFKVNVTVTNVTCGPTVTRFELTPEQGVKVKTIKSLADDIMLALAASGIRIEAPIPGKAAVGIEIPNSVTMPVLFGDLIDSPEFRNAKSKLTFAVGKDVGGKVICTDIVEMPHLLIAGATGSGKSVCINALIMSILYKAKPSEVRMIMIDPKRVELVGYNGIPHLLVPVVTDTKKALGALNWAMAEMDDRYKKFEDAHVTNITSYNHLKEEEFYEDGNEGECPDKLPHILIIIDELNDLMMNSANAKDVEATICRLTQLARACGIHVVIATQRPSVNVITGVIKANIPSRISFSVSSQIDSRTIIEQAGAEKLLGKGDMLFFPQGYPNPVRVQGAYISDREIASVIKFIKERCKDVRYSDKISRQIDDNAAASGTGTQSGPQTEQTADKNDELFEACARLIVEKQKATIGLLQRNLALGFNRAARIMDRLCEAGIVSGEDSTKPRTVLVSNLAELERILAGGSSEEPDADGDEAEEDQTGSETAGNGEAE